MMNPVVDHAVGFIADIWLITLKEKITEVNDARQLEKEITAFIEQELSAKYASLSRQEEIDYDGLKKYLCTAMSEEISVCLFDPDYNKRERSKKSLLTQACCHAKAANGCNTVYVESLIDATLNIIIGYYVSKIPQEYKFLNAMTDNSIKELEQRLIDTAGASSPLTTEESSKLPKRHVQVLTHAPEATTAHYTGRDTIEGTLRVGVGGRTRQLLCGMGGLGKSQIISHTSQEKFLM